LESLQSRAEGPAVVEKKNELVSLKNLAEQVKDHYQKLNSQNQESVNSNAKLWDESLSFL